MEINFPVRKTKGISCCCLCDGPNEGHHQKALKSTGMNNLLRGLISGYGAYKLGGGCLGTIVVFIIIWMLLGQCN